MDNQGVGTKSLQKVLVHENYIPLFLYEFVTMTAPWEFISHCALQQLTLGLQAQCQE